MYGITITYVLSGDEAAWRKAVDAFVDSVNHDNEVSGRFHYHVFSSREGNEKVHWGMWDSPETLQKVQSREYFKTFASAVRKFGGESLKTTPLKMDRATS
jgi:quinol monooxygenase YgiN